MTIPIVAVTLIINVLLSCSTVESRLAAPWGTKPRSRGVEGVDSAKRSLVSSNQTTFIRGSLPSGAAGMQNSSSIVVPGLFVFGDSTVDAGNNNDLPTLAQATFWPYGKDFDTRSPTGRFCDGRLSVDFIAEYLGLPLVPTFASGMGFSRGANFASAGSGVLPDTGSIFGLVIPFEQQLLNFGIVQQVLRAALGEIEASKIISNSVYYISTGSNDFINNYLLPNSPHAALNLTDFQQVVLKNFTQHVTTLFKMGARKIVVVSLSPLGCIPSQLYKLGSIDGECIASVNEIAQNFNALLADSLHSLRRHLPGALIAYNDAYLAFSNIMANAALHGFSITNQSCCGTGLYGGMKACLLWTPVCGNASNHLFWDEYHPSTASYKIMAETFWSGSLKTAELGGCYEPTGMLTLTFAINFHGPYIVA